MIKINIVTILESIMRGKLTIIIPYADAQGIIS